MLIFSYILIKAICHCIRKWMKTLQHLLHFSPVSAGPDPPVVTVKDIAISYYNHVIQLHCEIQSDAYEVGVTLKWIDPDVRL